MKNPASAGRKQGSSNVVCWPARDVDRDNPTFPAPQLTAVASTALTAVLAAPDLATARALARAGLDRIAAEAPCNLLTMEEAVEITRRTPSTVRRWAAAHHLGRRLGGEWILFRDRFDAFVAGGAP